MLGLQREEQLRQAVQLGLIPAHVCNSIRTNSPVAEGELARALTALTEGAEDGDQFRFSELYNYLLHFWEGGN